MINAEFPTLTVTVVVEYQGKFLLIKRSDEEIYFPSVWAFPGGKAEFHENLSGTIRREVFEETGLLITDEVAFINTYFFEDRIGVGFVVRATSDQVVLSEDSADYAWITSREEMDALECLPGLWKHLVRAQEVLASGHLDSLDKLDLNTGFYAR